MELAQRSVVVHGVGAMGGAAALVLAAAGVGELWLLAPGRVAPEDVPGAPLLRPEDHGSLAAAAAALRLQGRFPAVRILALDTEPGVERARAAVETADLTLQAARHAADTLALHDAALRRRRPVLHGGRAGALMQLLTVLPGESACLRCLFEEAVPPGGDAADFAPFSAAAGALLGAEAVRVLRGEQAVYAGKLLAFDGVSGASRAVGLRRRARCEACSDLGPVLTPEGAT